MIRVRDFTLFPQRLELVEWFRYFREEKSQGRLRSALEAIRHEYRDRKLQQRRRREARAKGWIA